MNNSFSVLISVYNREKPDHLLIALKSIYDDQILKPNEIVIVKDGPLTPQLDEVIERFRAKVIISVTIVQLDKNLGLGLALRRGLEECQYEIVARMDSDDISTPNRFEIQANFLAKNPQIAVVGSFLEEFEINPGDLSSKRELPISHTALLRFSKYRSPLNHMTVMFRKASVLNVGSYEQVPYFEDYYLWTKLLYNGFKLANLDEVLLFMRIGNNMIARRHGLKYVKYEFSFFYKIYKDGYLTFNQMILNLCFRLPFRLIPKNFLKLVYRNILRS